MKRFAIKFPNGTYSKGAKNGRTEQVAFSKAKLWTNIGHIKNHLAALPSKAYPKDAQIIEVEITHTETSVMSVAEAKTLMERRRAAEGLQIAKRILERVEQAYAKDPQGYAPPRPLSPLERARQDLQRAQERARRAGVEDA